jgi:hypothetical protein
MNSFPRVSGSLSNYPHDLQERGSYVIPEGFIDHHALPIARPLRQYIGSAIMAGELSEVALAPVMVARVDCGTGVTP